MTEALAKRVEEINGSGDGLLDAEIHCAVEPKFSIWRQPQYVCVAGKDNSVTRPPTYTQSIDTVRRHFDYLCVYASDIGADGLAMVKLVTDTSTSPIAEHVGIAVRLEHAWLAAALRGHAYEKAKS